MARLYRRGPFWWIQAHVDGERIRFSTKTRSEDVAGRILNKIETEIAEGRFLDKKRESNLTMGELATLYLDRMDQLAPKSSRWRRDRMKRVLAGAGRATPIEDVDPEMLDRYAEGRLRAGKAVSTVKGEIAVWRHMFAQAYRWKKETGLSENRLAGRWKTPRGKDPRQPVFLSRPEVRRLLAAARARAVAIPEHRRAFVLMRLALATGARVGELCRLQAADFDGARRRLRIRALKGGTDRTLELGQTLAKDLARLLKAAPEPFEGGGLPKDRFRRFWRAARTGAKLPHVRFHDLRHTFASEYLRRGGLPRALQDDLGHRTGRMTEKYSHLAKAARPRRALDWS